MQIGLPMPAELEPTARNKALPPRWRWSPACKKKFLDRPASKSSRAGAEKKCFLEFRFPIGASPYRPRRPTFRKNPPQYPVGLSDPPATIIRKRNRASLGFSATGLFRRPVGIHNHFRNRAQI